jgi:hypothetical protein
MPLGKEAEEIPRAVTSRQAGATRNNTKERKERQPRCTIIDCAERHRELFGCPLLNRDRRLKSMSDQDGRTLDGNRALIESLS